MSHKVDVADDIYWADFPGVRSTLSRWNVLPTGASLDEIAKTGLRVKRILNSASDPVESMVRYCEDNPPDLFVLEPTNTRV